MSTAGGDACQIIDKKKSVLFVSVGNICRSPLAEGIFRNMLKHRKDANEWKIDSCSLEKWHNGEDPDSRCMKFLKINGISNYSHKSRILTDEDFYDFHYMLGMDAKNVEDLNKRSPKDFTGKICPLGMYDSQNSIDGDIRDPYYDNDDKNFRSIYEQAKRSCQGFLEKEHFQ